MKRTRLLQLLLGLYASANPSHAYWRMACSVSQTSRTDAILNPNAVSGHVHKFAGGNNINQGSDFNSLQSSTCSSCQVQDDTSGYWTPQLYFAHSNGLFEEVPNYGTTVYYVGRPGLNETGVETQPFPPGFRMISGDSRMRSYDSSTLTYQNTRPVADRVSFRCINEANDIPEQHYMFRTDCVNGFRAQINFQSCWDGVNTYLENSAHVAYLSGIDNGVCPPSHPVPLPGLFFEVLYMTNNVDQSAGGQFVFSNGDTTGYGFHGDFMNGWKEDVQTNAVRDCLYTDDNGVVTACAHLVPSFTDDFARICPEEPSIFGETVHGMIPALPGCNPITSGPDMVNQVVCDVNSTAPIAGSIPSAGQPVTTNPTPSPSLPTTAPFANDTSLSSSPSDGSDTGTVTPFSRVGSESSAVSSVVSPGPTAPTANDPQMTSGAEFSIDPAQGQSTDDSTTTITQTSYSTVTTIVPPGQRGPSAGLDAAAVAGSGDDEETTIITETSYSTVTTTVPAGQQRPSAGLDAPAAAGPGDDEETTIITETSYSTMTVTVPGSGRQGVASPTEDFQGGWFGRPGRFGNSPGWSGRSGEDDGGRFFTVTATNTAFRTAATEPTTMNVADTRASMPTLPADTVTSNADITMTSASGTPTSNDFVSAASVLDNTALCSLYSEFTIEGCPPPTPASTPTSIVDATPSPDMNNAVAVPSPTATDTITSAESSPEAATPIPSESSLDTTVFTIRGRAVSLVKEVW